MCRQVEGEQNGESDRREHREFPAEVVSCIVKEVGMRTPVLPLLAGVGCLIAAAASAQVVRQEVPGIRNFAKVESTVACAGAITAGAIPEIKKMGYASIINLRLATEEGADIDGNIAAAKAAGIPYYHIPFSGAKPDPAVVDTFLKTITTPGVQPAFIH